MVQMRSTQMTADVVQQAQHGSVAAIIQILNDVLVEQRVRTRAVLTGKTLQLLCEADTIEQLEQTQVVQRVQETLEQLNPAKIRHVQLYGRPMQEQQVLWLEAVQDNQGQPVLWSTRIKLARPNWLQRLSRSQQGNKLRRVEPDLRKLSQNRNGKRSQRYPLGPLLLGAIAGSSLLAVGIILGQRWLPRELTQTAVTPASDPNILNANRDPQPVNADIADPENSEPIAIATPSNQASQADAFARAVWLAEQAVQDGQAATTRQAWLATAARWQEASDLMAQVPEVDPRYATAQDRVAQYRDNSQFAIDAAQALGSANIE
ncbi:MAG: hypothetical protein AAGF24_10130 [Cyanobacteria bacterium P01_H01_bin.121]